jgi:hypothetical protein
MRIKPTLTIRNESEYLVDGARVAHATPPAIEDETVYCYNCDSLHCAHADAVRYALLLARQP